MTLDIQAIADDTTSKYIQIVYEWLFHLFYVSPVQKVKILYLLLVKGSRSIIPQKLMKPKQELMNSEQPVRIFRGKRPVLVCMMSLGRDGGPIEEDSGSGA